jgi:membrane protein
MAVSDLGRWPSSGVRRFEPARQWARAALRIYRNIERNRVLAIAAGVTFYELLAIFPAVAALVSLYGLFADPATIATYLDRLAGVLPGGGIEVIGDQMNRVAAQHNGTLGLTFLVGLAVSLWSANAGMKALFDALNLVFGENDGRGFFRLNAVSLAFTTGAILFLLVAIAAMVVLPIVLDFLGLESATALLVKLGRWPALLGVVVVALSILYRLGPGGARSRRRWLTWGSAFAALTWLAASVLFSWYAQNFASYNATYGSLGAVIGFMLWMWLSTIVILVGAALDADIEQRSRGARPVTGEAPEGLKAGLGQA